MKFYSKDFENMATIPVRFTADGDNTSPTFVIEDVPEDAVSLALICHDPDATRGTPWVHWVLSNLKTDINTISDVVLPDYAKEGVTSFGSKGYGGPSPSPGTGPHRYIFTLYALSNTPNLDGIVKYEDLNKVLVKHTIASSKWTGIYERVKEIK